MEQLEAGQGGISESGFPADSTNRILVHKKGYRLGR
jgi:hypothetical protein